MADHIPQKKPPREVVAMEGKSASVPTEEPPMAVAQQVTAITESRPLEPIPDVAVDRVGAMGATWYSDKKITALWSINENRNSWIGLEIGWRKLANNSDSAIVALTMLASHAKQMERPVSIYEDDKQMITQMYVW